MTYHQLICDENYILNEINKKKLANEKYYEEKKDMQEKRGKFLEIRSKLSEEQKEKLDQEFAKLLPQKEEKLEQVNDLFLQGASVSFLKTEDHVFDNFSTYIRKDRFTENQIERYKIYINTFMDSKDLSAQLADITENETFFQILFRLEFKHIYEQGANMFKGAYDFLYHSALNFDISLGVKDLLETPYWGIFNKYEYNYEPQYALSENLNVNDAKQLFFELQDQSAHPNDFNYQMKFIEIVADNLDELEEHPNKRKAEINISEHYNVLFNTWDELSAFYKPKMMQLHNIEDEKSYYFDHETEIQAYEKLIKILVELIPIFYRHKSVFFGDLLDKMFLKFKGLVFKHMENDLRIKEEIKEAARDYLFKKYFGICLDSSKTFYCGKLDLDNLIEKSDCFKSLHKQYFENEEDMQLLYKCVVSFYHRNSKSDVIQKILKFEQENNFTKYNTTAIVNPLSGEKLF